MNRDKHPELLTVMSFPFATHALTFRLLISCPKLSNTSALAHCPRFTFPERCHNKFQLVYTYFYKHLKIITLTFSLCCETDQTRDRGDPGPSRWPNSDSVHTESFRLKASSRPVGRPDDLKLNVQHMNYVSCLIK